MMSGAFVLHMQHFAVPRLPEFKCLTTQANLLHLKNRVNLNWAI